MKKFKNLTTGLIEVVSNKFVIEQMESHKDLYEEVTDKATNTNKKNAKVEKATEPESPEQTENPEQTGNEEVTDKAE